jgi:hypothetical protein
MTCWICGEVAVGTGHIGEFQSRGIREVCKRHIKSVVLYKPFFEDHTIDDALYDLLRGVKK